MPRQRTSSKTTCQADADVGIHLFRPLVLRSMFARPTHLEASAWIEHIPFAFWLIEAHQPRVMVELGTYHGTSYFAFCQAVERLGLDTRCFAVDTWKGDEHSGLYGENVFEEVMRHNDAQYSGFSRLIRSTFDAAFLHFSNQTIDLLHIDGYHTLDAVTHDFEKWLPKLSERAVVLLHDTNVRERDFGVFKLFEELQETYPAFEFVHGHGLGILGVGPEQNGLLKQLFKAGKDEQASRVIYDVFGRLGRACADARESSRLKKELGSERHRLGEAEQQISRLNSELESRTHAAEAAERSLVEVRHEAEETAVARAEAEKVSARLTDQILLLMADMKERQEAFADDVTLVKQVREVLAALDTSRHEIFFEAEQARARQSAELGTRLQQQAEEIESVRRLASGEIGRAVAGLLKGHSSLSQWRPFRLRRQITLLRRSGLFDAEWYLRQNTDVASAGIDPLRHYVEFGAKEGRAPNAALAHANGKAEIRVETVPEPETARDSKS